MWSFDHALKDSCRRVVLNDEAPVRGVGANDEGRGGVRNQPVRLAGLDRRDGRLSDRFRKTPGLQVLAVSMARRPRRATTGPDHGVEVVALDYRECQKSGGGIHCSTAPLVRDRH
jgi:hypothetical protein